MDIIDILKSLLHFDSQLRQIIDVFGAWTYVILFIIIFAETGLVIVPFLPGDSLLFIVGSLAGSGYLNFFVVYTTLLIAAILGDSVNYSLGRKLGKKAFTKTNSMFFSPANLEKTRKFYEKYGSKTIILARFVPIIRTFAPFVAGIGEMHYSTFAFYNVLGGFIWVTSLTSAGYFFGGMEIVKNNFEIAILVIIFISILPVIYEYLMHKKASKEESESVKTDFVEIKETFEEKDIS